MKGDDENVECRRTRVAVYYIYLCLCNCESGL